MYFMIYFDISLLVERDMLHIERVLLLKKGCCHRFWLFFGKLLKYNMVDTACFGNIIIQRINVQSNLPI